MEPKTVNGITLAEVYEDHFIITWPRPEGDKTPGQPGVVFSIDELDALRELLLGDEISVIELSNRAKRLEDTLLLIRNMYQDQEHLAHSANPKELGARMVEIIDKVLDVEGHHGV